MDKFKMTLASLIKILVRHHGMNPIQIRKSRSNSDLIFISCMSSNYPGSLIYNPSDKMVSGASATWAAMIEESYIEAVENIPEDGPSSDIELLGHERIDTRKMYSPRLLN